MLVTYGIDCDPARIAVVKEVAPALAALREREQAKPGQGGSVNEIVVTDANGAELARVPIYPEVHGAAHGAGRVDRRRSLGLRRL